MITANDLQYACAGSHGVAQGSERMASYRADLYGLFSIICTLARLNLIHDIKDGSIMIACDNKASLENALCHEIRASVTRSSHDILWAIHELRKDLSITLTPKHVKGHQDRKFSHSITLIEKLNCYTDEKSRSYRKQIEISQNYKYSQLHISSN